MTLLGTRYPQGDARPRFYHHLWMQYLLDSFERVEQVVDSLASVTVDGHCQWHFFASDRELFKRFFVPEVVRRMGRYAERPSRP